MGGYSDLDDSELSNLPPEAWGAMLDEDAPFDPDDEWISAAETDDQLTAMRAWFNARFMSVSFDSEYGAYKRDFFYSNEGPFSPEEKLRERFNTYVSNSTIIFLAKEFTSSGGKEWYAASERSHDDYYDESFDLEIATYAEPLNRLQKRINEFKEILNLQQDAAAKDIVGRLVFSSLIGVLESFLWETAQHWIDTDDAVLRRCIEKLPAFRDKTIKMSEIFDQHSKIKETVKGYLQNLVWHRWDHVGSIYKIGLEVTPPSFKPFVAPLIKRHNIIHRSGTDKDGNRIEIKEQEINQLAVDVYTFATKLAKACADKYVPF